LSKQCKPNHDVTVVNNRRKMADLSCDCVMGFKGFSLILALVFSSSEPSMRAHAHTVGHSKLCCSRFPTVSVRKLHSQACISLPSVKTPKQLSHKLR
jgi:hypothetical protein